MIQTTLGGETAWILNTEPNWDRGVDLSVMVPTEHESGLTGRERRQPIGESLRSKVRWQSILDAAAYRALRDGLAQLGSDLVIIPCWPLINYGDLYSPLDDAGGTLWIGWDTDWGVWDLDVADAFFPEDYEWFAPALVGRIDIDLPILLRPDRAIARFTFIEDSTADYRLVLPDVTWPTGPALNDATTPAIFPLHADWSTGVQAGTPAVEITRREIGRSRFSAVEYYPQNAKRAYHARITLASRVGVAKLLRWWQDNAATTSPQYLAIESATGVLASDGVSGTNQLTLQDASSIGPYRYLALRGPAGVEIVRVNSVAGNDLTLSANLVNSWPAATTLVCLAALARHSGEELELRFQTPELASAEVAWIEVPEEYVLGAWEVRGDSLGRVDLKAWLYEFTLDVYGSQTVYRYTSYERDLVVDGNTYTTHPIEHSELRASIDLTVDEVTLKTRTLAVLEEFLPGRLTGRVLCTIKECDVTGGTGSNAEVLWSGEVARASFDGPFVQLTARGPYALFDQPVPRLVVQPQCNHTLFDARCGLSQSAWTFTAEVVSGSGPTVTLDTFSRTGGLPTGWGFEDYFALGYVERSNGEILPILRSSSPSAGEQTLILDRSPATAFSVDEEVSVIPGCDGRLETCQAYHSSDNPEGKFNNYARFGGFPWVPTKNPAFTPPKRTGAAQGKK